MDNYDGNEIINIGTGHDVTISELAHTIKELVGYTGELEFDLSKPDGTPRKVLNVDALVRLGWQAQTPLAQGIAKTLDWYMRQ